MCTVDIYKCTHILPPSPETSEERWQALREHMAKIDSCYNQPSDVASAGTTTPAGKSSGDIKNDALGNPGRFKRNETSVASEEHDVKSLRDKQLDSNFMQSNGFSSKVAECNHPAPRRGFGTK